MSEYMFRTTATMKDYNRAKWWIAPEIIRTKYIDAENIREALKEYAEEVKEHDYITISANALRTKSPMYRDRPNGQPEQVGYVITASTEMQYDNGHWATQYINLWIEISKLESVDFEEAI